MSNEAVASFIKDVLTNDSLEQAFNTYIVDNKKAKTNDVIPLFQSFTGEALDAALKQYVNAVSTLNIQRHMTVLFAMLESAVNSNVIQAKAVCEAVLLCDNFHYSNAMFWCLSLDFIRRLIPSVDYKGVRDLLKLLFDKAQGIPDCVNVSDMRQLNALQTAVERIFDRNSALLPSYLILDDVQKRMGPGSKWPHWKLARLVSEFVDSFVPCAQMVTIIGRSKLLPVVGHSGPFVWKLEPATARFVIKGQLPYAAEVHHAQEDLLRYVLEQPYSREMACSMLSLTKQQKSRCSVLEEQLVNLMVTAMERSEEAAALAAAARSKKSAPRASTDVSDQSGKTDENGGSSDQTAGRSEDNDDDEFDSGPLQVLWQNLSSQLIYFVLFQYASFPHMVLSLHLKLVGRELRAGRDHLMWVLLQFISGSIQKNPLNDFLPVMKLYDLLYPEKEPLPFPDVSKASCTYKLAIASIWIHLMKKAQSDKDRLQRTLPPALVTHRDRLQQMALSPQASLSIGTDYWISLLCNAYSTNQELFSRPMGVLVEAIQGGATGSAPLQQPLPMKVLDSLTVHTKMSLIHHIVTHVMKIAPPAGGSGKMAAGSQGGSQSGSQTGSAAAILGQAGSGALSPTLIETYSRLLVYNEIESLGIKGFISHLLPTVFRQQAWGILHTLLEMFSYRLHHIQPHYRVQLLSHLHSLATVPQTNQTQLHLCVESTALKLITGLGSNEVQPQLSRFQSEPKTLLSSESEELNKALILTLARAIHVTGSESLSMSWCKDILTTIMQNTPHSWSSLTLMCFPPSLAEFFRQHPIQRENKAQLKRSVEEEYRKWKTMSNENDIVAHFSQQGTPHLFLCLLWKMLLENDRISPLAYKILDRLGARSLSLHLRTFADFLVYEVSNSVGGQHVNKCIDALNDLIWKCYVISLDRLILTLALRSFEGNEIQVSFFIIHMLLVRPPEFRNRVAEFVKENSPEHWKQTDWHEKHLTFQRKYPEKFYWENLNDQQQQQQSNAHHYLPVYFGNICLRFLPVLDIVIHRFLELPPVPTISVETLLDSLGCLYKFHDRPLTYLYNTLHYYEQKLKDRPLLKCRLVASITGSLKDIRSDKWALSEQYSEFLVQKASQSADEAANASATSISWSPELDYYIDLVRRVADTMDGKSPFPHTDWRFNEFPNAAAHALHVTCIELMALPVSSKDVGDSLLDVVLKGHTLLPRKDIMSWMNAIGLILTALPESYWTVLNDRIENVIQQPPLSTGHGDIFDVLDFAANHARLSETSCCYLVALVHAVWYHATIGQISQIPVFLREKILPVIKNETQLIFILHLVAPFFHRMSSERTRCLMDLTRDLYSLLEAVDKRCENLRYMDQIADLFYHIKYMFTGDSVKGEVEHIIRSLRAPLQMRLRFITHLNIEEVAAP